jgi:hypothetical protein
LRVARSELRVAGKKGMEHIEEFGSRKKRLWIVDLRKEIKFVI